MKITKEKLKILKKIVIVLLWIIVLFAIYNGYNYNKYWKAHPQTEFNLSVGEEFPEELQTKAKLHNSFVNISYIILLLVTIYIILDYFYDKENHFYTIYIKKLLSKLEDDEDEKDGD